MKSLQECLNESLGDWDKRISNEIKSRGYKKVDDKDAILNSDSIEKYFYIGKHNIYLNSPDPDIYIRIYKEGPQFYSLWLRNKKDPDNIKKMSKLHEGNVEYFIKWFKTHEWDKIWPKKY